MRPEPLTEPLTEPPTQCKSSASIGMDALRASLLREEKKGDDREGKQAPPGPHPTESPPSLEAQCYAEAREIPDGERSASVVAKALKIDFWDAAEALEIICGVKANGGDSDELAHALWIPK
jgi:hypothetical protein